ncbi:AAA family ATPase [Actinophytocola algeriensis]|uniref:5-methylcytosine-specific restriction protein B n=1 Tax=Actinophytocola algeriensis TaxID=1768010 RepID=A0A7W7VDN4_9PSEU|nr:AAA family ATPase [Actinophytocola algeriensis]MBB4906269.1 5-methylcytosine-specific restriction protein B [Actinophytocola algeriensis]MBE1472046.1 5-methylcytosine-specific restriction protein B [Actinophytocola algeriensis]
MTFADRNALYLRTAMEVLRDAKGPLRRQEVAERVRERVDLADDMLSVDERGRVRWQVQMGFRTGEAATVGWLTKGGGSWTVTETGLQALLDFPGTELLNELRRLYRARNQATKNRQYRDPRWATVLSALELVGPGNWTTYGDLANLVGMSGQGIGGFMAEHKTANGYRVLTQNGTISPNFQWWDPDRTDLPREVLEAEGVEFDDRGRASPGQRLTTDDFRDLLGDLLPQPTTRRAWLVRGSSVDGRDLVPVWLRRQSVSLAASGLRAISPPVPRTDLKSFVDEDYQHKPYSAREAKVNEFDAFCNRMRVGDLVLTTTGGKTYVGRIAGDAEYVSSSDKRSNLRRRTTWLNDTGPVPFAKLPDPLPAKLHNQSDVVDLTENLAAVETLLRDLDVEVEAPTPTPQRTLAFTPVSPELADELMIDQAWLQRQTDLLWHRRQLILYGPPGTGKTFLARKIAQHLAEPSAIKLVQFHPSYTYEDFFEGFRPVQRDDGQLAFELRPGPFRALVDDARQHPSDPYILIIDEINRANLAKVFGELYFLLEYRDDSISLLYSTEADFTLPKNVFVIGTMNTTDRSIALVDAAMRRRFAFVELHPSLPPTSGLLREWLRRRAEAGEVAHHADAADLLDALNRAIDDRDLAVGPSYLMHSYVYDRPDALAEVWETSILPLLEEHHYGSPREVLDRYRLDALRKTLDAPPAES